MKLHFFRKIVNVSLGVFQLALTQYYMTENEDGARPARPAMPMEEGDDDEEDSDDDYVPPETEPEERPRRSTRKKEKPTSSSK